MTTLIHERVELARQGKNRWVIAQLPSGWAVMGDVQYPLGYALLLADPVVGQLNDLDATARSDFLHDMTRIGDALLAITGAARVNYEIQGNTEHALHAHIFSRYQTEPPEFRRGPVWRYPADLRAKQPFTEESHGELRDALAAALGVNT